MQRPHVHSIAERSPTVTVKHTTGLQVELVLDHYGAIRLPGKGSPTVTRDNLYQMGFRVLNYSNAAMENKL